jgi:hypothetical protein
MSDASGSSDDGDGYAYGESQMAESRRYPVHDCCEFDDADALSVRIIPMGSFVAGCVVPQAIYLAVIILGAIGTHHRAHHILGGWILFSHLFLGSHNLTASCSSTTRQ